MYDTRDGEETGKVPDGEAEDRRTKAAHSWHVERDREEEGSLQEGEGEDDARDQMVGRHAAITRFQRVARFESQRTRLAESGKMEANERVDGSHGTRPGRGQPKNVNKDG